MQFPVPPPCTQDTSQLQEVEPNLTVGSQVGNGTRRPTAPPGSPITAPLNKSCHLAPSLSLALSCSSSRSPDISSKPAASADLKRLRKALGCTNYSRTGGAIQASPEIPCSTAARRDLIVGSQQTFGDQPSGTRSGVENKVPERPQSLTAIIASKGRGVAAQHVSEEDTGGGTEPELELPPTQVLDDYSDAVAMEAVAIQADSASGPMEALPESGGLLPENCLQNGSLDAPLSLTKPHPVADAVSPPHEADTASPETARILPAGTNHLSLQFEAELLAAETLPDRPPHSALDGLHGPSLLIGSHSDAAICQERPGQDGQPCAGDAPGEAPSKGDDGCGQGVGADADCDGGELSAGQQLQGPVHIAAALTVEAGDTASAGGYANGAEERQKHSQSAGCAVGGQEAQKQNISWNCVAWLRQSELEKAESEARRIFNALLQPDGSPEDILSFAILATQMDAVAEALEDCQGATAGEEDMHRWRAILWLLLERNQQHEAVARTDEEKDALIKLVAEGQEGLAGDAECDDVMGSWIEDELRSEAEVEEAAARMEAPDTSQWWSQQWTQGGISLTAVDRTASQRATNLPISVDDNARQERELTKAQEGIPQDIVNRDHCTVASPIEGGVEPAAAEGVISNVVQPASVVVDAGGCRETSVGKATAQGGHIESVEALGRSLAAQRAGETTRAGIELLKKDAATKILGEAEECTEDRIREPAGSDKDANLCHEAGVEGFAGTLCNADLSNAFKPSGALPTRPSAVVAAFAGTALFQRLQRASFGSAQQKAMAIHGGDTCEELIAANTHTQEVEPTINATNGSGDLDMVPCTLEDTMQGAADERDEGEGPEIDVQRTCNDPEQEGGQNKAAGSQDHTLHTQIAVLSSSPPPLELQLDSQADDGAEAEDSGLKQSNSILAKPFGPGSINTDGQKCTFRCWFGEQPAAEGSVPDSAPPSPLAAAPQGSARPTGVAGKGLQKELACDSSSLSTTATDALRRFFEQQQDQGSGGLPALSKGGLHDRDLTGRLADQQGLQNPSSRADDADVDVEPSLRVTSTCCTPGFDSAFEHPLPGAERDRDHLVGTLVARQQPASDVELNPRPAALAAPLSLATRSGLQGPSLQPIIVQTSLVPVPQQLQLKDPVFIRKRPGAVSAAAQLAASVAKKQRFAVGAATGQQNGKVDKAGESYKDEYSFPNSQGSDQLPAAPENNTGDEVHQDRNNDNEIKERRGGRGCGRGRGRGRGKGRVPVVVVHHRLRSSRGQQMAAGAAGATRAGASSSILAQKHRLMARQRAAKEKQEKQEAMPPQEERKRSTRQRRVPKRFQDTQQEGREDSGKKDHPAFSVGSGRGKRQACAGVIKNEMELERKFQKQSPLSTSGGGSTKHSFGCSKCRWVKSGCSVCRNEDLGCPKENGADDEDQEGTVLVCPKIDGRGGPRKSVLQTQHLQLPRGNAQMSQDVVEGTMPAVRTDRNLRFLLTGLEGAAKTEALEAIRSIKGRRIQEFPSPPQVATGQQQNQERSSTSPMTRSASRAWTLDVTVVAPLVKETQEPRTTAKYLMGLAAGCRVITPEWLKVAVRGGPESCTRMQRHVLQEPREAPSCLAGLPLHLAGDSRWKDTFKLILRHAGAIPLDLADNDEANEPLMVVANPFQIVKDVNPDLSPRTARQLLHAGCKIVPGEWVLQALKGSLLPGAPNAPEGLESAAARGASAPVSAFPPNSAPAAAAATGNPGPPATVLKGPAQYLAPGCRSKPLKRPRRLSSSRLGRAHIEDGWLGEPIEPPEELRHMRGQSRTFHSAYNSAALGGSVSAGDCVEVEAGPGEHQIVRVVAMWEESTRAGSRQLMQVRRFYSPQDTIFPESGLPIGFHGELFASGHTHDALALTSLLHRVHVKMAPPGMRPQPAPPADAGTNERYYVCRYFYDHMQQQLRALPD